MAEDTAIGIAEGVLAAVAGPGAVEAVATESDERAFAGAHLGYRR